MTTPTPPPPASLPRDGAGPYSIGSDVWPGLSKLIEEMGELQQVLGKLIATGGSTVHWDGDLRVRLVEEIADALGAIHFFVERNLADADMDIIDARQESKLALFLRWHQEALK